MGDVDEGDAKLLVTDASSTVRSSVIRSCLPSHPLRVFLRKRCASEKGMPVRWIFYYRRQVVVMVLLTPQAAAAHQMIAAATQMSTAFEIYQRQERQPQVTLPRPIRQRVPFLTLPNDRAPRAQPPPSSPAVWHVLCCEFRRRVRGQCSASPRDGCSRSAA